MKKLYFVRIVICFALVATLLLGDMGPVLSGVDWTGSAFAATANTDSPSDAQNEGVVRPEDIDEGLSVKSLEDIRGRRVTVRQPVMEILDDNVERPDNVPVLEDTYVLGNLKTREVMDDLAKVTFAGSTEGNGDPIYPRSGLERSPRDENTGVVTQKYFTEFEKYMLLRQAYYFNTHAMEIVREGKLAKHPAADGIYGKVPDTAKAVKMRIVTDPIYRSPMTTGLYLVAGEAATVKISGLKEGETLTLYTHHQDTLGYLGSDGEGKGFGNMEQYIAYWDAKILEEAKRARETDSQPNFEQYGYGLHGQWAWQNQKVPCMGTTFNIVGTGQDLEVNIGSMYGGPLYVKPTDSSVELQISGAVLTPHFVLGVTTVDEFEDQLRNAPGLVATLDVENGQLIGPAADMRNCDDIEKLAYFWHSVFAIDISLNGRAYNYNMTMCYDMHVPAGEAVALNSNFCAQPSYWFDTCMNYEELTTKGNWGTFHELGHVQAKTHGVNWGFCDGDGEVWNNTLILIIYSMLCNMDTRIIGVEHGEYVHPYTAIERSQNITQTYTDKTTGETVKIKDYGEINNGNGAHFDQLSMYATLLHSFGAEKFVDMFYTYKLNPAYCANKRADFVYRIGVVDHVDITDWVNDNYFANVKRSDFTADQRNYLDNLPKFVPVAYRWANGIDGNETARKVDVDGKFETVFDLSDDNFSSPKQVQIISVSNAEYGTANYDSTTRKVTYKPPQQVTEYDSFEILVSTEGGRRVTLNVNMRLVYRGTHTDVWTLGTTTDSTLGKQPTLQQARDYVQNKPADSVEVSDFGGKPTFTHNGILEYFRMQFKFVATEDGAHTFYLRSDDAASVEFFKDDEHGDKVGTMSQSSWSGAYSEAEGRKCTIQLNKGDMLFVKAELVNWGGQGFLHIGYKSPSSNVTDLKDIPYIPAQNIVNALATKQDVEQADKFAGWQPRFVDSIKDAAIDYTVETTDWQVLVAPPCENGSGGDNMVDGDVNTAFHSKYQGQKSDPPHTFVIDTGSDSRFNYFEILRRTYGNDKLLTFALYGCKEADFEKASRDTTPDGWTTLFNGSASDVNAARQRLSFEDTVLRYFKLVILTNSGNTVIKEVYAGIQTQLNQTVRPANFVTEQGNNGFTENSANGKLTTSANNAFYEMEFIGTSFDVFADTAPNYGSAKVYVNDQLKGTIDLNDRAMFNKCVFNSGEMQPNKYKVRIVTDTNKPFNISFVNFVYGTPIEASDMPATTLPDGSQDWGDQQVARRFSAQWRTFVKDYKTLKSIKFIKDIPDDYQDTFVRIDEYIRLYRKDDCIAFVYPGTIVAPFDCGSLFAGCAELTELVLDNFDTTTMQGAVGMFNGCAALQNVDLERFATGNALGFGKMFANCTQLQSVDMGNFDMLANANIYDIFYNCPNLQTVKLPQHFDGDITCQLPYVYLDVESNTYSYELRLNASTAGHTLQMHVQHSFDGNSFHKGVAPQCTVSGNVAYYTCTLCKCNFTDQTNGVLLRGDEIILPETGHNYYYDPPEDWSQYATCTEKGICGAYRCLNCNDIKAQSVEMPALGHTYRLDTDNENAGGNGYKIDYGADGKATVTFYLVCQSYSDWVNYTHCNHKTEVVITFDYDLHQDATCTEDESYFFDAVIDKDLLEHEIVLQDNEDDVADGMYSFNSLTVRGVALGAKAMGHSMQDVAEIPATCTAHGSTAGKKCSRCNFTQDVTATEPLGHQPVYQQAVAPTCTHAGHTAGTVCSRCGELYSAQKIDALGHEFTQTIQAVAPTCTENGHTEGSKCSRCGVVEGCDVIPAKGHTEQIVQGKPATTKEKGLTDGVVCSDCGEVLVAQQEIPKLLNVTVLVLGIAGGLVGFAVGGCVLAVTLRRRKRR